jgi:demethylmenaquinone methyltransferase/2-methoxy-6-polyprenyl-1,4-benzoquinol methylase
MADKNSLQNVFVEKTAKQNYIREMFDSIAYRYDFLNHLLSFGLDFYWRWFAIHKLNLKGGEKIIDIACGTGDFSIMASKRKPSMIFGVDVSLNMLKIFRQKALKKEIKKIYLVCASAENLPFKSEMFDVCLVAFGVRNFSDLEAGLKEIHRVLKNGGKIVVLEFSMPKQPFKLFYLFYFRRILPFIGKLFSKHENAYTYLPESVLRFPEGEDFAKILNNCGFKRVELHRLTFGIVTLYIGVKN